MSKIDSQEKLEIEEIVKRLDLIVYLLLERNKQEGKSNRELIKELLEWGLKDFEIAKILGRSRSYVASECTQIKKSFKKVRKNER